MRIGKFLIFLIAICNVAIEALPANDVSVNENNVCSSEECVSSAKTILENMDQGVDPCVDFYQFACGNFSKTSPNWKDDNYLMILGQKIKENLGQVIKADYQSDEPKVFKLVKKLYRSCMNTDALDAKGLQPLKNYLQKFGGWPVVDGDSWNGENFDWRQTIYKFWKDGDNEDMIIGSDIGHLIGFRIDPDIQNPSKRIMTFYQPDGLMRPGIVKEDFDQGRKPHLAHYYKVMVDIATMLGADNEKAKSEIREMMSFEMKLANIKLSPDNVASIEHSDAVSLYKPMSIADLSNEYPTVPWMKYVKYFVGSRISVSEEDIVTVQVPDYYIKLEALMKETSKRTQANYVISRIALRNAVFSTELMRHTIYKFLATITYSPSIRNRANYCLGQTIENLRLAVAAMYVNVFSSEKTKKDVATITNNVALQFKQILESVDWMDEATRQIALEKLAAMNLHVGHPEALVDHQKLEEYYGDLEFTEDDYFGNVDKLSNHNIGMGIAELRQTEIRSPWEEAFEAITANAGYWEKTNTVRIPAAVLQGLYYGADRPSYMNYGAAGTLIGEQMTHGFFELGSRHGKDGKPQDWWSSATKKNFEERSSCIIDQYKSFRIDDIGTKLNAEKTFEHDVADIGCLRPAYQAYKNHLKDHPDSRKIPGLEKYTTDQMFWLSAASVQCARIDAEWIPSLITYDEHSLPQYRVIGSMSNTIEFATDFNCVKESLMNPPKRCPVW